LATQLDGEIGNDRRELGRTKGADVIGQFKQDPLSATANNIRKSQGRFAIQESK
jgi:hypothetical protein